MKKLFIAALVAFFSLSTCPSGYAAVPKTIVASFDGKTKLLKPATEKVKGEILIPIKPMFELFGLRYGFDEKTRSITGSNKAGNVIVLKTGEKNAEKYGEQLTLKKTPLLFKANAYLTMSDFDILMDANSNWIEKTFSLNIRKKTLSEKELFRRSLFGKTINELSKMLLDSRITTEQAEILINKGADVNTIEKYGGTPVSSAIIERNLTLAEFFLQHGADPNLSGGSDDRPVLHMLVNPWYKWASSQNFTDEQDMLAVKLLLKYGADPNRTGSRYGTQNSILEAPVMYGRTEFVAILLENGANPNGSGGQGTLPPLRYAIFADGLSSTLYEFHKDATGFRFSNPEIVKLLLEAGAAVDKSLLDYAKQPHSTGFEGSFNGEDVVVKGVEVPSDPEIIRLMEEHMN